MAGKPMVAVEGTRELRKVFKSVGEKPLLDALKHANKSGAELVVARALPNVPFKSGKLRRSVRATATQRQGVARAGRASTRYAAAIHWGRKRGNVGRPPGNRIGPSPIRGRPFLWNAAQASRQRVISAYVREIDELLDTVRRRTM